MGKQLRFYPATFSTMPVQRVKKISIAAVTPLPPTQATKVFAVGMNFASHLASNATGAPPLFLKLPSSLIGHTANIELPDDAENVHFEGEFGSCHREASQEGFYRRSTRLYFRGHRRQRS